MTRPIDQSSIFERVTQFGKECCSLVLNLSKVGSHLLVPDIPALFASPCRKQIAPKSDFEIIDRKYSKLNNPFNREELYDNHTSIFSIPGCSYVWAGKENEVCFRYALENYTELHPELWEPWELPRNPVSALKGWSLVSPSDAAVGDLIFYFNNPQNFPNIYAEHVGVISKVEETGNGTPLLVITSKWGKRPIYEHNTSSVPSDYGSYFLLMRSPFKEQAKNSLNAKFMARYPKFVLFSALSAIAFAGWYIQHRLSHPSHNYDF